MSSKIVPALDLAATLDNQLSSSANYVAQRKRDSLNQHDA